MMQDHVHGPDGQVIPLEVVDESAAVEADAVEAAAAAQVEIAQIEAERDVELGKQSIKREELWSEQEKAELYGELRGIKETLAQLVPEPEPEPAPVVIAPPVDEGPEPELAPAPEPDVEPEAAPKKKDGFFGPAYR